MSLISESEKFFVTSTVAIGYEVVSVAVRIKGKNAIHLFLTVTVLGEETASETTIIDFYLCA